MTKYVVNEGEEGIFQICLSQGKWTDLLDYSSEEYESKDQDEVAISQEDKCCLISHEPLDENCVTLPCNHSFNFLSLYKEVLMHRSREDMPILTVSQNLPLMDGLSILLQRDMCITIIQKLEFRSGNDRQKCNKRTYKIS